MPNRNKFLITTGLASVASIAGIAIAFGAFEPSGAGATTANPAAVPKDRFVAQANGAKCNPCAAKKCNPCAAKRNPCAAKKCNPCAAAKCNPCAAKKCSPCNPCNPCAAKNPCNPCAGANPCNPCNPCAPQGGREISNKEAAAVYALLLKDANPYLSTGSDIAADYRSWSRFNTVPYQSATHGGRYVNNYADGAAAAYGKFEDFGEMPVGSILAKDSFTIDGNGQVSSGPLFLMRKMEAGFRPDFGDWEYTLIMPGGDVFGITKGAGSDNVDFCGTCHMAVPDQDHMFFLPLEYRKK
jgi:hypothetical protein